VINQNRLIPMKLCH